MRRRGPVILGEFELGWCRSCNLPLLGKICDRCKSQAAHVPLTPPRDARPAFDGDLKLLRTTIARQFGQRAADELFPNDKLIVLNRTPALDRADEVVVDGVVVGILRFDPKKLEFEFSPKIEGARRIALAGAGKWVRVDDGAVQPIINGASILAPGVIAADRAIEAGEEVFVVNPNDDVIAVGRSRMRGDEMLGGRHGMAVKARQSERPRDVQLLRGGQTWEDAVDANRSTMKSHEEKTKRFIAEIVQKHAGKPVSVAFSGGKDSLATLLLVKDLVSELKVLFVDTGLEFPETVEHTRQVAQKLGAELIVERAGDAFWQAFEHFGPPGRDYRWCCKTCKLGPTAKLIREQFPNGCITFVGQRKYESDQRHRQPRVWENPWVPKQVGVSPIRNWTAMHVWLYLIEQGAEFNPLYERGLERIGCWLCPASDIWESKFVEREHVELWKKWVSTLSSYAEEMGYSETWLEHGFWRWQELPAGQLKLAEELGIEFLPKVQRGAGTLSYKLASGFSPCKDGRTSIDGSFNRTLDVERAANMLRTLGKSKCSTKLGVAKLNTPEMDASIYRAGKFSVISRDEQGVTQSVPPLVKAIIRAELCVGCGVCVARCQRHAISLVDGKAHIDEKCNHCLNCFEYCPILFFD